MRLIHEDQIFWNFSREYCRQSYQIS